MRLAIYAGTFDPFTLGHLDVLRHALRVFDRVEVTVAVNSSKTPLLSLEERVALVRASTAELAGVEVAPFEGLLVEYAARRGAAALVRGLRQVSDFDYELRMAFANRRLRPEIETVFFLAAEEHALTSATLVREIYRWGGDVSSFVPGAVREALERKRGEAG